MIILYTSRVAPKQRCILQQQGSTLGSRTLHYLRTSSDSHRFLSVPLHTLRNHAFILQLSRPSHPTDRTCNIPRRRIPRRSARIRDTIVIAEWILHIVEGQDATRGVVAALIDKMDGDAAAGAAAVFEDGICEGSDLLQGEGCALGEEAWCDIFSQQATLISFE